LSDPEIQRSRNGFVVVFHLLKKFDSREISAPLQEAGPELYRTIKIGTPCVVGSDIPRGSIGQDRGLPCLGRKIGDQRAVPVDLMCSYPHGGVVEPVSEQPPLPNSFEGGPNLCLAGIRAVEQDLVLLGPDLGVASHGLAIETQVVRGRAEEHVEHVLLTARHRQLVFVPSHPGPAIGSLEGMPYRTIVVIG
jgi:hypothetical protein